MEFSGHVFYIRTLKTNSSYSSICKERNCFCNSDESFLQWLVESRWHDPKHLLTNHTVLLNGHLEKLRLYFQWAPQPIFSAGYSNDSLFAACLHNEKNISKTNSFFSEDISCSSQKLKHQIGNQILRHCSCSGEWALFCRRHFTSFAYNNISVWQVLLPACGY